MKQANPLKRAHLDRLHRREDGGREPAWALHGELTANPPGRLGRRLLPEIESYLEFFAIARGAG